MIVHAFVSHFFPKQPGRHVNPFVSIAPRTGCPVLLAFLLFFVFLTCRDLPSVMMLVGCHCQSLFLSIPSPAWLSPPFPVLSDSKYRLHFSRA
jgi:hypothetical protein